MQSLCIQKVLPSPQDGLQKHHLHSRKRRPFLLVEVLIAISLMACVAISIFSIEKRLSQSMQNAHMSLDRSMAESRAITLLIEELSLKKIPFDVLTSNKPIHYDLNYHDWSCDYSFSVNRRAPEAAPTVFHITADILLQAPRANPTKDIRTQFTFTVSRTIRDGGNT